MIPSNDNLSHVTQLLENKAIPPFVKVFDNCQVCACVARVRRVVMHAHI